MKNKFYAGYWILRFLCEYLTNIRNLSANTLKSYRDAIRLLMPFIAKFVKKVNNTLLLILQILELPTSWKVLKKQVMLNQDQESQTGCFLYSCKVCIRNSPEHIEQSRNIRSIPVKKTERILITYLEKEKMNVLLDAPNKGTIQGWRDYTLLLFRYNTGTRAEKAVSLLIRDLSLPKKKQNRMTLSF